LSASICISVPEDLRSRLDELAQTLDRPRSYIIKKALEEYLEEYTDYLIAIERLNDKDDKIITGKQLRDKLGL
jgi:RHH-type rel operon transcriptional repressor/antitoxin RelB